MSNDFAYQCPHCNETIQLSSDVMGEVMDCPVCENPFKVDIPTARPADANTIHADTPALDRPDRVEGELMKVHPAMLRSHPLWFLGDCALVVMGVALIVLGLGNSYEFVSRRIFLVAGGVLIVAGSLLLLVWWLRIMHTTLRVTTKRTILRKGIIAKNTSEVQHDDVRNIIVNQSFYERLVGVGDLAVSSAAQGDLEIHVHGIPGPDEVAEIIRDLQ